MLDTILPFIAILLGLVILHELGHFVAAKLAGVRVEEFGIGMPPRIAGIRFGETIYSINWLPLGGFVRLTGEESARVFVDTVNIQSAAARAGLKPGDVILKVGGTPVHNDEQLAKQLRLAAAGSDSIPLQIERERQGARGPELEQRTFLLEPQATSATTATDVATHSPEPAAAIGSIVGIQTSPDPRSLATKPRPVRIAVMAAGAATNFIIPIVLFAVAALIPQAAPEGPAVITSVVEGAPAERAGLQAGDRVVSINGEPIQHAGDLSLAIQLNVGNHVEFVVEREVRVEGTAQRQGSSQLQLFTTVVQARLAPQDLEHVIQPDETIHDIAALLGVNATQVLRGAGFGAGFPIDEGTELVLPDGTRYVVQKGDTAESIADDLFVRNQVIYDAVNIDPVRLTPGTVVSVEQGPTGITIANLRPTTVTERSDFFSAVETGWVRTVDTFMLVRNRIRSWIAGGDPITVSGPIGLARATDEIIERAGWLRLIELAALLSLNLAVINILPLPMLDGGRIMFVLIEIARRGRRISPEKEGLVHLTGFAIIIAFMVIVGYFDIIRAIAGESALR